MPVLWQSSQRPMYVRTVWVGGFRHAILNHDDPYFLSTKRRPYSSATCTSKSTTRKRNSRRESENLEDCLRNLNFVIKSEQLIGHRPRSSQQPDIEKLDLTDVEQSEDEFLVKGDQHPVYESESSRSRCDNIYFSMRTLKTNRTARNDVKETELSERVLQWLDLAGKVDLLAPEKVERMTQPRHSWPEIQRRNQLIKSKTTVDVRKDSKTTSPKVDSAKSQNQITAIDRQDFYVPASANTIENYARQSRNQNTPQENHAKLRDNKTKVKDLRTNIIETRQKVALERNAMEKKYAELISKKLIPELKSNKKQVHIFMPELPKKTGSTTPSRTESLLSQFSQLTQNCKK